MVQANWRSFITRYQVGVAGDAVAVIIRSAAKSNNILVFCWPACFIKIHFYKIPQRCWIGAAARKFLVYLVSGNHNCFIPIPLLVKLGKPLRFLQQVNV
jgi:hypothetical protein